jgi:hypothetical protein
MAVRSNVGEECPRQVGCALGFNPTRACSKVRDRQFPANRGKVV